MRVAIHQPHYFPWIGYFDKMAKADKFIILDQVQFEKGSQMIRNRVIDTNGGLKYITISGETRDFLEKDYRDLATKNTKEWTDKQLNALRNYYRKAFGFSEVMPIVEEFLSRDYPTICEWTCASMKLVCKLLEIQTPIIMQSQIKYDQELRKSDLVFAICKSIGADIYFSGSGGSVEYLDREKFLRNGVDIVFQKFKHPIYSQINTKEFVSGVSILDLLFNCGVEDSRAIFWDNVYSASDY